LVMHCIDRIFANLLNPFKQTPHGIEEYIVKKVQIKHKGINSFVKRRTDT
jgi:hypothetical protein